MGKTIKVGRYHRVTVRKWSNKLWYIYSKEFHAAIKNVDIGGHLLT